MRTPSIGSIILFALLASASAEEAAKPAPSLPTEETSLLADLRTTQPQVFQYGSWSGKLTATKSGLAVLGTKGAQGDGGMGCEIAPPRDMSQVAFVEVALGVAPGNEVPQFTIAFNDADGTQFTARITIDQLVPGSPVWLRARREDFKLNGVEKGSDSQMDWSKVTRWHLQGDWQTKKNFQVIFVALRTRK